MSILVNSVKKGQQSCSSPAPEIDDQKWTDGRRVDRGRNREPLVGLIIGNETFFQGGPFSLGSQTILSAYSSQFHWGLILTGICCLAMFNLYYYVSSIINSIDGSVKHPCSESFKRLGLEVILTWPDIITSQSAPGAGGGQRCLLGPGMT